jgi:benzoate membrane transport protein
VQARPALVLAMIGVFLAARLLLPRYAVLLALVVGVAIAWADGSMGHVALPDGLTRPVWVTPHLSLAAVVGVALPVLLVSLASQTLPGVAVLRADGYDPPVSTVIAATGLATVVSAPFGAFSHSLVAITAAICTGREAHPDPTRRYTAAITAGVLAIVIGIFGGAVAGLFAAFPHELVAAIAGLALLGAIANGLTVAVRGDRDREAALVTFLVTASGVTIHAVGSAFWGLVAGTVVLALRTLHARTATAARA